MNQKDVLVLVFSLLMAVVSITQQLGHSAVKATLVASNNNCTIVDAQRMIETYSFLQNVLSDRYALGEHLKANPEDTSLIDFLSKSCADLTSTIAQEIYQSSRHENETIFTDRCLSDDPENPCCNTRLLNQCCFKRNTTHRILTQIGTSTTAQQYCGHEDRIRSNIGTILRSFESLAVCASSMSVDTDLSKRISQFLETLGQSLFEQGSSCLTDEDCPESKCEISGRCQTLGIDLSGVAYLGKSLLKLVGSENRQLLASVLNIERLSSVEEIGVAVRNLIGIEGCYSFETMIPVPVSADNRESCETSKVCSHPSLSESNCEGPKFCGVLCHDRCHFALDFFTEAQCNSRNSFCTVAEGMTLYECLSGSSICDVPCNTTGGNNCSEQECNSQVFCKARAQELRVFIDHVGSCLYRIDPGVGYEFACKAGTEKVGEFGCLDHTVNKQTCEEANGYFIEQVIGSNCPQYFVCEKTTAYGVIYTAQNKVSCEQCGGSYVSALIKSNGTFTQVGLGTHLLKLQYKEPKLVRKNIWTRTLDFESISDKFQKLLQPILFYKTIEMASKCINPSLIHNIGIISCDCATDRNEAAQCFGNSYVAKKVRVSGSQANYVTVEGVSITIPQGSLPTNSEIEVTISFSNPDFQVQQTTRSLEESSRALFVEDRSGRKIGQLFGTGFSFSPPINNVKVCVQVDPRTRNDDPYNFIYNSFAIVEKGLFIAVDTNNENDQDSDSICGYVSDSRVYYPAKTNTIISSASNCTHSSVMIAITLAIVLIFSV